MKYCRCLVDIHLECHFPVFINCFDFWVVWKNFCLKLIQVILISFLCTGKTLTETEYIVIRIFFLLISYFKYVIKWTRLVPGFRETCLPSFSVMEQIVPLVFCPNSPGDISLLIGHVKLLCTYFLATTPCAAHKRIRNWWAHGLLYHISILHLYRTAG